MRPEIKNFLDSYIKQFEKAAITDVEAIILFGSQAKGCAAISSDIDLAIVMKEALTPRHRGYLLSLGDEIDYRFETNLFFTTKRALDNAEGIFDTNRYIRDEGIVLWQE